jgi:hypothetical protein
MAAHSENALARQIIILITTGDIHDINNLRDQIKTLIDQEIRRDTTNVTLKREDILELQAYLHILSVAAVSAPIGSGALRSVSDSTYIAVRGFFLGNQR